MDANMTMGNVSNGTEPAMGPPGSPFTAAQILAVKISLIIISFLTVAGNSMVIIFVATKPRLRTKTNAMVVSLAVSDLIVGLFLMPSFFACLYVKCDEILTKLFYDVFLFTSVLNLCCITTDRFLAVTRPLKYHLRMTTRTVIVMITLSWVIPAIIQLIPASWYYSDTSPEKVALDNKIFYTVQVVVFMFLPCVIMSIAYWVIFNIARKHSRYIRHMVSNLSLTSDNPPTAGNAGNPHSQMREARATIKVFGTVLLVFIFCWILSAFRSIVTNYNLLVLNPHLVMASRMFLVTNSAINPMIYAFWKKDIKLEVRKLLGMTKRGVRPSSSGYNNGGLARSSSHLSSKQDISLPVKKKLNKTDTAQTPGIVQVTMAAENSMEEIQEEEPKDVEKEEKEEGVKRKAAAPEPPQNKKNGIVNPGADVVDGIDTPSASVNGIKGVENLAVVDVDGVDNLAAENVDGMV